MISVEKLSGRARVNRMFERRDHDRVPRHDSFWGDTIARWQGEGLAGDAETVLDLLRGDFQSLCWCWPAPFPGRREIISEDSQTQIIRDAWGAVCRFWKARNGTPEHIDFGCETREQWEQVYKPAMLAASVQINLDEADQRYRVGRGKGRWCHLTGVETFEATRKLIGDETTAIAMAEDPDWIVDISRTHTDLVLANFQAALDRGIAADGVWIYGDMAYNHATVCSPAMYRDLVWPDHKRLADWAHQNGMKFIFHTDGDIRAVIPLYIEAGFDCLQPLEAKANVDIRELCPAYGEQLAFMGNVDVMTMMTNDLDRIEQGLRAKLAAGMATRGYAYHSDHSVPPQVSWETYRAIIDMIDRYGNYR